MPIGQSNLQILSVTTFSRNQLFYDQLDAWILENDIISGLLTAIFEYGRSIPSKLAQKEQREKGMEEESIRLPACKKSHGRNGTDSGQQH